MQGTRIALQSGMAKVTFDCGAEVVLEGPCDFVARAPMLGFLKSGRITADVPRRAFAFAILSSMGLRPAKPSSGRCHHPRSSSSSPSRPELVGRNAADSAVLTIWLPSLNSSYIEM